MCPPSLALSRTYTHTEAGRVRDSTENERIIAADTQAADVAAHGRNYEIRGAYQMHSSLRLCQG